MCQPSKGGRDTVNADLGRRPADPRQGPTGRPARLAFATGSPRLAVALGALAIGFPVAADVRPADGAVALVDLDLGLLVATDLAPELLGVGLGLGMVASAPTAIPLDLPASRFLVPCSRLSRRDPANQVQVSGLVDIDGC